MPFLGDPDGCHMAVYDHPHGWASRPRMGRRAGRLRRRCVGHDDARRTQCVGLECRVNSFGIVSDAVFALTASTGLGLRFAFAFGTPFAVAALGGGLLPCELRPLTLLVI